MRRHLVQMALRQYGTAGIGAREADFRCDGHTKVHQVTANKMPTQAGKATTAGSARELAQHIGHHTGGARGQGLPKINSAMLPRWGTASG
jgi:hypothetical protein